MSYYLRYWADVRAVSCDGGTQKLDASLSLSQAIAPAEAATLPPSVTGGGNYGTEPGSQLVLVRLYGPTGGTFGGLKIDGKVEKDIQPTMLDGRPVVTLAIILETRDDVVITWSMEAGAGQTGDGVVDLTPGVQRGSKDSSFASPC